jgi:type III pantothenate kinase
MILCADIGNTNITIGAFEGKRLEREWRLATDARKTADEYGVQLKALLDGADGLRIRRVEALCLGSVVPALTPAFEELARRFFGVRAFVVTAKTDLGLRYKVDNPAEVGADRVLNALAAWKLHGGPVIVLDFGTATTFDCVSKRGEYLGGAILIGPQLASRALAAGTAQLPQVEIRRTERVIGRNTLECLQAGLYHGYLGMIERVLRLSIREMGGKPKLIATGGLAGLYAKELSIELAPDLTLQGLRLAYEAAGKAKVVHQGG